MKQYRVVLIILVAVCVVAGLAFISFRVAKSQTNSSSEVASSRGNAEEGLDGFAPTSSALAVEGRGLLERLLAAEISRGVEGQPKIGRVDLLKVPVDQVGQPLMYVIIERKDILWTPVFARSTIEVNVAYSTTGDVSFRDGEPTHFVTLGEEPVVQYFGRYTFEDQSLGIFSWPGYQDHLAEQITKTLLASLQDELNR